MGGKPEAERRDWDRRLNLASKVDDELQRRREVIAKYTDFLLAASGAGVALAVRSTADAPFAWTQVPLGFAVAAWAWSFYVGTRVLVSGAEGHEARAMLGVVLSVDVSSLVP